MLNSNDSRYWGFVPEEFIVWVVARITYPRDRESGEFRWDRLLKGCKLDINSKKEDNMT